MKNILNFTLLLSLLILTSCGTTFVSYQGNNFQIEHPQTWKRIIPTDNYHEIIFMGIDPETSAVTNLNIAKNNLSKDSTLEQYVELNIDSAKKYPGYKEIKVEKIKIDEQDTRVHIFEATEENNKRLFLQTYIIKNQTGYILTASLPIESSASSQSEIKKVFKSLKF